MSTKPVPDPKEADEHRERMKAFYRKVAGSGLTLIPDEALVRKGASTEPPPVDESEPDTGFSLRQSQ